MGFTVYAPRQDGNAKFSTLQVQLTESSSITRVVVADGNGKFFYSTAGGGGTGTVTNVSVATANGFSGSIVNPTTTPTITLSTTVTGILLGNGTSITSATAGTDYITPTLGTASWAQNSVSSSNAVTASYALNATVDSGSFLVTASAVNTTITFTKGDGSTFNVTVSQSGSVASASYALYAETASWSNNSISASSAGTASWASNFFTASVTSASIATSASFAETASWANNFLTSSVTSASFATSASNATTASFALNFITSSVTSASFSTSASFAATSSWTNNFFTSSVTSASFSSTAISSSFATTASYFSGSIMSLTTNGNAGPATLTGSVLNIPIYTDTTNGLVSGGVVSWSGTGWIYDVSAAYYYLNGIYYTTSNTQVTLGAADISNPRLDIVAVNDQGQVIVIPGTPSSNPVKAQIDPLTEIELTTILVPAGATSPVNITTSIIYDEVANGTWTSASSGVTVDFANPTNPYTGVVCASVTATTTGTRYIQFDRISGTDSISNYSVFKFAIRLGSAWTTSSSLAIGFYNGNTLISTEVSVLNGQYGFSSSTTATYQLIQIPVATWRFTQAGFSRVRFRFLNSIPAFRLDRVELQAGVVQTLIQSNNIYTSDGSLAGIRTLTLNGNYLDIVGGSSTTRFNSSGSLLATGSLFGTSSWASNFFTASVTSASIATTSSFATSASFAATSSWANNFLTSSVTSASYARTASAATDFVVGNSITASNALVTGTLTVQTIVAQSITSSTEYITGSTQFGSSMTNTHQFTGSVSITGSLGVVGQVSASGFTGSLFGTSSWASNFLTGSVTSASFATSASNAATSSWALNFITSSVTSASFATSASNAATSSWALNFITSSVTSASFATSASNAATSSWALNFITSSVTSASFATSSSFASTSSWANNFLTSSVTSASIATSASNAATSSWALNFLTGSVTSASFATSASNAATSSWALNFITGSVTSASFATSASNAATSSWALNFITGSVTSASYAATSSWALNFITSSVTSASYAISASNAISSSTALQANNASAIDVFVFGSDVESYLLMSNVAGTTGVSVGGDADLRYNASTNKLTVGSVSATSLTGSLFGTASWAVNFFTASVTSASIATTASFVATSSWTNNFFTASVTSASIATSSSFASTSSWANNFFTASVTSASFATTASYAANGGVTQIIAGTNITVSPTNGLGAVTISSTGGSGGTGTNTTASFTNLSTWTFNHNLNSQYVIVQTIDTAGNQMIPQNITLTSGNTATITFPTAESGVAIASLGGVGNLAATASSVLGSGVYGTVTVSPNNNQGSITVNGSNTVGGANYIDFIKVTNSAGGATNPNKTFRINNTGTVELINSAYTGILFSIGEGGGMYISASLTMPNRPAFRVSGSGITGIPVNTILSGSAVGVDYNQGNYYNNANGKFTAPVAGLYSVYFNCRTQTAGSQQVIIYKNTNIAMMMWETNANTGHFGISSILNLALNDTIEAKVTAGTIQFDGNDNWGAAYIG